MSNEKRTIRNPAERSTTPVVRGHGRGIGEKPPAPEIINLEIDENDDFGGDPYNRTGSHCVLKISDDD